MLHCYPVLDGTDDATLRAGSARRALTRLATTHSVLHTTAAQPRLHQAIVESLNAAAAAAVTVAEPSNISDTT
jgi:hypothetical protein